MPCPARISSRGSIRKPRRSRRPSPRSATRFTRTLSCRIARKAAALIADYLQKLGLEVQTGVAHHGRRSAQGRPARSGRRRARGHHALPVTEQTNLRSRRRCGRRTSARTSASCTRADMTSTPPCTGGRQRLTAMKANVPGTVKFIFQPAEEGVPPGETGGASLMVKEGVLEHRARRPSSVSTFSEMAVGDIGYSEGPRWPPPTPGR